MNTIITVLLTLYKNNGSKGQLCCKICSTHFSPEENRFDKTHSLRCPYCNHALVHKKDRKFFRIHKCVNPKRKYYLNNARNIDNKDLDEKHGKNKYKLHYIYREFNINFFKMGLDSLPKDASSLKFRKNISEIMANALTLHINLGLSLRKTSLALRELWGINVSHTMIANYAKSTAVVIKPFVDHFPYNQSGTMVADETYIKVQGVKAYIWLIMYAVG